MQNPLANRIINFVSGRTVTIAVILFAIIGRVIQLIYFYNIYVDGAFQVMAMQNFVHGHGITTGNVLSDDLSSTIYQPLVNWPAGYSILLAPFYIVSGHNYIAAGIALEIMAAVVLIVVARRILAELDCPKHIINLSTLVTGFFIYPFYFISSSDSIAISFLVAGILYALLLLKNPRQTTRNVLIVLACLFMAAFIKYLFMPVVFVVPAFLFLKGYSNNNSKQKKLGFIIFLVLAATVGMVLLYHQSISGSAAYISSPGRSFYPEHLKEAYPFVPAAFLTPKTTLLITPENLATILYGFFQLLHFSAIVGFFVYSIKAIFNKGLRSGTVLKDFTYLTIFISLTILVLLSVLSIRVSKEEILPGYFWTYVQEPRYYGLAIVMIQLCLFGFLKYRAESRSIVVRTLAVLLVVALSVEMLRGMAFDAKRILNFRKEEYNWVGELRIQQFADKILLNEKRKYPAAKVVVTGSSYYINHRISLFSHTGIMGDADKINDLSLLNTKQPVILLIVLYEKHISNYQAFLSRSKQLEAGRFNGYSFYTVYVSPH